MIDHFLTIDQPSSALLKEKSSKFYAYAFPVRTVQNVEEFIGKLKKEHLKARHFCYAYVLGADKQNFRANDDGEPSGTAGKPILGQLEKRNLVNTIVVVVRYFGGTKLGTSGLIKAYKESASLALDKTNIIEELIKTKVKVNCTYENIGTLMNVISSQGFDIKNTIYEDQVGIILEVRLSKVNTTIKHIKAKLLHRSIEDIKEDTEVDQVSFEIGDHI